MTKILFSFLFALLLSNTAFAGGHNCNNNNNNNNSSSEKYTNKADDIKTIDFLLSKPTIKNQNTKVTK